MSRLVFGSMVPCRYCDMRGKVKIDRTDPTKSGKRKRVTCPVCKGAGVVVPAIADRKIAP